MRRNMKITITAMAVLLLMAIAATIISFSFADNNDEGLISEEELLAMADDQETVMTIIDYIIRNSNDAESDDPEYHIVELGSSATPSTLQDFVESSGFKDYVLDGHRTIADMMAEDKITYQYIQASTVTNTDSRLADVAKADLIYVSNAGGPNGYRQGNDICEELYNLLHTYAVGDYKPLIIDSPTKAGSSTVIVTSKSFTDLVKDYFAKSGAMHYTYGWNTTNLTTEAFFKGGVGSGSMYIGINGRKVSSAGKWVDLQSADENLTSKKMANFLVISADGAQGTMTDRVLLGAQPVTDPYNLAGVASPDDASVDMTDVYDITNTALRDYGYNPRYPNYKPDFVKINRVSLADVENEDVVLDQYDMIIIEDNCGGAQISAATYKKLIAAMYADIHIVYNESLGTASDDEETGGNLDNFNETNYSELFYMVATDKEVPRFQNIMVTNKTELDIITSSGSVATCQTIADLINASSWRGIGGPASSSSVFTVLEIQPCYPISTELAQAKGSYYVNPSEVVNGQTKEQLGITDADLTDTSADISEFYDWELSAAKVADALGMDAKAINVVHMSSEELEANKTAILGNYDLIYIGGNTSALREAPDYGSFPATVLAGAQTLRSASWLVNLDKITMAPVYAMYSHVGDFVQLNFDFLGQSGFAQTGKPLGMASPDTSANGSKTFAVMNGNDITYNNYQALVEYVDAGMPVVFSKRASAAFTVMNDAGYLQNSIDPDSNMAKFMKYCYVQSEKDAGNILWNLDEDATELVDNDGGLLGSTKTGYVEVFQDDVAEGRDDVVAKTSLNTLYIKSSKRPKLTVTSRPVQYNLYDPSTKLKDKTLTFKYDVTGIMSSYTVNLYVDDDGNSIFSNDEIMATSTGNTLTYSLGNYSGGPVYWKLEVRVPATSGSGYVTASTTGTACIAPDSNDKKTVNILQILPSGGEGAQGVNSLYFCPECQMGYKIMHYNPANDAGSRLSYNALYDGHYNDNWVNANGYYMGTYRGRHEHRFGIVKYDSNMPVTDNAGNPTDKLGRDDWDWNLADEIKDTYDFHIDIISNKEYDAMADDVQAHFAGMDDEEITAEMEECETKASSALVDYNSYVDGEFNTAEEELREVITHMVANATTDYYRSEFQRLLDTKVYYDFYNIWGTSYQDHYATDWCNAGENFVTSYEKYARCVDKKIELREIYDKWLRYAKYTDNWLGACYDCVVIGPAEDFNWEDIESAEGLAALVDYADNDGAILLFHETLSRFEDKGSWRLTAALRDYFGMDATHLVEDTSLVGSDKTLTVNTVLSGQMNAQLILTAPNGASVTQSLPDFDINTEVFNYNWNQQNAYSANVSLADKTGSLNDAGNISVNVNLSGIDFSGYSAQLHVFCYYPAYDKTYNGTVSGNSVSFAVANYEPETKNYAASDVYYIPYKADTGYDSNQYFMSNLSYKDKTDTTRFYTWRDDLKPVYTGDYKYLGRTAFSDINYIAKQDSAQNNNPYPYSELRWASAAAYSRDAKSEAMSGTNKASQNNSGIVTTYPFTLSAELNISGTHPSAYALDVEDTDLTVWYTLGGGSVTPNLGTRHTASSLFAATPRDGKDNYFIYSSGNVYYCGAGHTKVTGVGRDNNDERRLYINIICNSVRSSVRQPSIDVYDYDTVENKVIVKGSDGYIYEIGEEVEYPIFTFHPVVDKDATITNVNIYFKRSLTDSTKFTPNVDRYIVRWTGKDVKSGDYVNVGMKIAELKLVPEDFEPYGGNYTYIVIEVIDSAGNVSYQKIKVVRKPHLFDLT